MNLQEQIQRIQEMMGINPDNERKYIDWDENYGKTFKVVRTPEGRQSVGEWNPNLISVVTPENSDAWTDWEEVSSETLNNWKNNWNEIQKSLGQHKYDQIIRSQGKSENKRQIDWSSAKIIKRNSDSTIIYLSPEKVLERVGRDMGSGFDIRNQGVRIGDRLKKAMEWLENPETPAYQATMLYVEPWYYGDDNQIHYYDEPKIGISDGRHRLLAAYNLGLEEFPFEVFNRDEEQQIKDVEYLESNLK